MIQKIQTIHIKEVVHNKQQKITKAIIQKVFNKINKTMLRLSMSYLLNIILVK